MMNQKVMQRLVWKDARTLAPLIIAIFAAIVGLNLLCFVVLAGDDFYNDGLRLHLSMMLWILLPNLFAFGAASLLVGAEEESGSLAWLRTLPANWFAISTSKLLVTTLSLAAAWILASLVYWIQWTGSSEVLITSVQRGRQQLDLSAQAVLTYIAFSIALMITSFVMAYWFRSPINALLAVLPVMFCVAFAFVAAASWILKNTGDRPAQLFSLSDELLWYLYLPSIVVSLVVMFVAHQWVARRRLSGPETNLGQRIGRSVSSEAFRPPSAAATTWYGASLLHSRPSKRRALIWQATNQNGVMLMVLTIVAVVGASVAMWSRRDMMALGGFAAGVSLFCIAGFTFYGDSVRRRSLFLSDRGISPTLIWQTRLFPTACAVFVVVVVMFLNVVVWNSINHFPLIGSYDHHFFLYLTSIVVGYSLCQLISQWAPRPVLAFLAAPLFCLMGFAILSPLYDFYREGSLLAAWVAVPILLFASWKLTPRWVSASMGQGYNLRFVGYLAAAVALPYIMILGIRIATIPADQTAWREQMLAYKLPERPADDPMVEIHGAAIPTDHIMYNPWMLAQRLSAPESSGFEQRFADEMASDASVGQHVSMDEMLARLKWPEWNEWIDASELRNKQISLGIDAQQEELRMAKLLLKWSSIVRHEASYGHASFYMLTRVAERAEQVVADILDERVKQDGMTPEIRELIAKFPNDELVLKSRRNSLIAAWQNAERLGSQSENFPGLSRMPHTPWIYQLETLRRERFINQTVKMAEGYWGEGNVKSVRHIPGFFDSMIQAGLFDSFSVMINDDTRETIQRLRDLAARSQP